jgi:hypothetical protein
MMPLIFKQRLQVPQLSQRNLHLGDLQMCEIFFIVWNEMILPTCTEFCLYLRMQLLLIFI